MAPITHASDESNHNALLEKLDIFTVLRPFRNPHWKPAGRRNKNVKQIISDLSRKEASLQPTQNNSGSSTPLAAQSEAATTEGVQTPATGISGHGTFNAGNMAHATQRLDRLVLERNQLAAAHTSIANGSTHSTVGQSGMLVTYSNIESAPSLHPSSQRRYCDITGLSAPYTDPKSRLRYHNVEVFSLVRQLGQSSSEQYLAARGAHTVLK